MRHTNRIHNQTPEPEPNLFDFVPKSVWREVYRGRWAELGAVQLGTQQRPRPKRLPWVVAIQELGGPNPLVDYKGQPMKFVKHLAPVAT
jgi:hypothetical protein